MSNSHEVAGEQMARVHELPCTYCHGVRLVGWSGAGPILCPECSRGQDAFTVITQAWREQRTKVAELSALVEKMVADYSAARASALESLPRIAGKTAGFDQPGREYTAGDALGLRRDR